MKRYLILFALLMTCTLALSPLTRPGGAQGNSGQNRKAIRRADRPVPDSYIVVLKNTVDNSQVAARAEELTHRHGGSVSAVFAPSLRGFAVRLSERAAEALNNDPLVEYVEEDAQFSFGGTQINAPNSLDRIDQRDFPLNNTFTYNVNATGAGVHAYVIDSGVETSHPDFGGRAFFNFDATGSGPGDCNGHGTAVASLIGGSLVGPAKNVTLHSVRVAPCGGNPTTSTIISGVNYVTNNHQSPAVANISLIGSGSSSLDSAVVNSINSGVTYVVNAGNDGGDAGSKSPARVTQAITVSSIDQTNDVRPAFSNVGPVVDLFAPGVNVLVAAANSGGQYGTGSETSYSAPLVAGVAAQYLESNPFAAPSTVQSVIVNNATVNHIVNPAANTANRILFSNFLPNPIDDSRFYVRQHYLDFLNRLPDADGWNWWTNEIEQCNDPNFRGVNEPVEQCKARKRVDVSDAFWFSDEFLAQQPTLAGLQRGTTAYNQEFVRLCYVVYLRRNPNDPPDNNFDGYNYWLNKLNTTYDYKDMINGFITSIEYRARFGPN